MLSSSSIAGELYFAQDNSAQYAGFTAFFDQTSGLTSGVDSEGYFYWTGYADDSNGDIMDLYYNLYSTSETPYSNGTKLEFSVEQDWHNESSWTNNGLLDNQLCRITVWQVSGGVGTPYNQIEKNNSNEILRDPIGEYFYRHTVVGSPDYIQLQIRYQVYYELDDLTAQSVSPPYFGVRVKNAKIIKPFDQS